MKKILVLGGGGFIGRNIVQYLIERGDCIVTAADIKEGSNWKILRDKNPDKFKSLIADFTKKKSFDNFDSRFDEIYFMAAVVGVNNALKNPYEVLKVNTLLTMNMIEWIKRNPIKRILFASSSENYAGTSDISKMDIPTSENVPLCITDIKQPRWTYAISKIHGESAFIHASKANNFETVIIRNHNIIGPNMGFVHVIPHIIERFVRLQESPFKIYGYDQTRSFCFIDDAVEGIVGAMECKEANGEIYHIGNSQEISMEKLSMYLGNLVGYAGEYKRAITFPNSVSRRCPNINKAKKDFHYSPKISWEDSVYLTAEWYINFFKSGNKPTLGGFKPPEFFSK